MEDSSAGKSIYIIFHLQQSCDDPTLPSLLQDSLPPAPGPDGKKRSSPFNEVAEYLDMQTKCLEASVTEGAVRW